MSVIVKGMKMPKNCVGCEFINGAEAPDCLLTGKDIKHPLKRQDFCPLVEFSEKHGQIIDKAEYCLLNGCPPPYDEDCANCIICDCKVILESEGNYE